MTHLVNVQKLITTATVALVNASDQLQCMTIVFADQSMCSREQPNPSCFIEAANEMLASNGDVTALLGTAQQELSIRSDTIPAATRTTKRHGIVV